MSGNPFIFQPPVPWLMIFNVARLHWPKEGKIHMWNDAVRDTFANLKNNFWRDVEIEPHLQSFQGESFDRRATTIEEEARLDVKVIGLWGTRFRKIFIADIFNSLTRSCSKSNPDLYTFLVSQKRLRSDQRIIKIETGSLSSSVFACIGVAWPTVLRVNKILAAKICI